MHCAPTDIDNIVEVNMGKVTKEQHDKKWPMSKCGKPITTQGGALPFDQVWCEQCSSYGHSKRWKGCKKHPQHDPTFLQQDPAKAPTRPPTHRGRTRQVAHTGPRTKQFPQPASSSVTGLFTELQRDLGQVEIHKVELHNTSGVDCRDDSVQVPCDLGVININLGSVKGRLDLIPSKVKVCLDSGAVAQTIPELQKHVMDNIQTLSGMTVKGITGPNRPIRFKGDWRIPGTDISQQVECYAIPGSTICTISISWLAKAINARSYFDVWGALVWEGTKVILMARQLAGLYILEPLTKANVPDHKRVIMEALQGGVTSNWLSAAATMAGPSSLPPPGRHLAINKVSLHTMPHRHKVQTYTNKVFDTGERLMSLHEISNHEGFETLRKRHGFPPSSEEDPNPKCTACNEAGIRSRNTDVTSKEAPTRPNQFWSADVSRTMAPGKQGLQRYMLFADGFTDEWFPLFAKRKSDLWPKVINFFKRKNNYHSPNKIARFTCDGDSIFGREYSMEGHPFGWHWMRWESHSR